MKFDWLAVLRDVLIALLLAFLGGYIGALVAHHLLGAAAHEGVRYGSLLGLVGGFCLVGVRTREARLKHLGVIVVGAWLLGSGLSLALGRTTLPLVLGRGLLDFAIAGVAGGLLSWVIARPVRGPASPQA